MPGRLRRGVTICEAHPNAKAPSANLSYVDAQEAYFKKRREEAQAARNTETAVKSMERRRSSRLFLAFPSPVHDSPKNISYWC